MKISIYDTNSVQITVDVVYSDGTAASLAGYTAVLYIKKYHSSTSAEAQVTGTTSGNTITFDMTTTDTDITPGKYIYEALITNGTYTYTVAQDDFVVLDSLATPTT